METRRRLYVIRPGPCRQFAYKRNDALSQTGVARAMNLTRFKSKCSGELELESCFAGLTESIC